MLALQLRDREGAKQDLQSHAVAYKRKELQVSLNTPWAVLHVTRTCCPALLLPCPALPCPALLCSHE